MHIVYSFTLNKSRLNPAVGFSIGEGIQTVIVGIGIVFPGSVTVYDTLHAAVIKERVDRCHPVRYDLKKSSDPVIYFAED